MQKWILPVSCVALVLSFVALAANFKGRIGIIDVNKVMEDSPKAQSYRNQLAEKYESLTKELEREKNLGKEEKEKKHAAAYDEFLKTKNELEKKLEREVAASVGKVARRRRLSVVLYKNNVAWGGVDITSDVIQALK